MNRAQEIVRIKTFSDCMLVVEVSFANESDESVIGAVNINFCGIFIFD